MNYVILAGGTGTRLWPMSRDSKPKQLFPIISDVTMLEDTLKRLEIEPDYRNLYIATGPLFVEQIKQMLPDFPIDHYIIDPIKRDTGPAMALAAAILAKKAPDEPIAFIASDHFIRDIELFRKILKQAETLIRETGKMVNIGIVPTFPNVQMGHIKIGTPLETKNHTHSYSFEGFVEKPEYALAKQYMESGQYLWNANFYMWTPAKFLEVYKRYAPEIGNTIEGIADIILTGDQERSLAAYSELPKISIDYAVSEKMDPGLMIVIKGEFGWSDIGSWEQLYEQLGEQTDERGNLAKGNWVGVDTTSSLIYGQPNKVIATVGLSDIIIVDTADALLICPRGRAADVKKIVEKLKEQNQDAYL